MRTVFIENEGEEDTGMYGDFRKNTSTLFFRVLAIIDILVFFLFFVAGTLSFPPSGRLINDSFLRDLQFSEICSHAFVGLILIFAFLLVSAILVAMYGKNIISTVLIGAGIVTFIVTAFNTMNYIIHKPVVVKCECVRRDISYDSDTDTSYHILFFDNGTSSHVTSEKWQNSIGKTFYVVMCGNDAIASYDPADYMLEE